MQIETKFLHLFKPVALAITSTAGAFVGLAVGTSAELFVVMVDRPVVRVQSGRQSKTNRGSP